MKIVQKDNTPDFLEKYSTIPISFRVNTLFKLSVDESDSFSFTLEEQPVDVPYIKDYDAEEGGPPNIELERFDLVNWVFYGAYDQSLLVGGFIMAYKTLEIHKLEERDDISCLWDIRIHPDYRGQGIGKELFKRLVSEAKARKCKFIKIETTNDNVNASRFYQKQGCKLGQINRYAYQAYPDDVQLMWYYFL